MLNRTTTPSSTMFALTGFSFLCTLIAISFCTAEVRADDPEFAQVQKVFTKYCAGCHNVDEANGDFALDTFDSLLKGGESGNAITPGSSKSSRMLQLIKGKLQPKMPPADETAPSDDEVQLIADWIDAGAIGPKGKTATKTTLDAPKIESKVKARPITTIALANDESLLAIGRFGSIEIRDTKSDKPIQTFRDLAGKVTSVQFLKEDKFLLATTGVSGLYGEAVLFDLAEDKIVRTFRGHRDMAYSAALSQDENWIATSGYDKKAVLWKLNSKTPIREFLGHNDAVFESTFDNTGKLLITASADATVKIWNAETADRLDTRGEALKEQYTVAIHPSGETFVAGGEDNRIRKWKLVSRKPNQTNPLLISRFAHESSIQALRFHPNGKHLVSVGGDGRIKIWDAQTLTQKHVFPVQTSSVQAISIGEKELFVGRMDGSLEKLDWPTESLKSKQSADLAGLPTKKQLPASKDATLSNLEEAEPNDSPADSMKAKIPFTASGVINSNTGTDVDTFRFAAKKGQRLVIETKAARNKSPLDSYIAVLSPEGKPVPRVLLHAVRDSYFTFRGKNSKQTGDFRIHNWEEMQLNQLLYCNGEVVKLYHYPRGPDSGFNTFPNFKNRHGFFDTTPIAHALQEPCYIVQPHPPGTVLPETGLPKFLLNYENDDESTRRLGSDSRIHFVAPNDGEYLVQVKDSRGFQGEGYKYQLSVMHPKPSFKIREVKGKDPTLVRGTYKKFSVEIERDYFSDPVKIEIDDLPIGVTLNGPVTIERDGLQAFFTLYAAEKSPEPEKDAMSVTLTAIGMNNGSPIRRTHSLGIIKLGSAPKLKVELAHATKGMRHFDQNRWPVFEIHPGETISARVIAKRLGHSQRINFGQESAALNLPFGVYVDNTGLNGVLIPPSESERTFSITAEPWVKPCERLIFLEAAEAGKPSTNPGVLRVTPWPKKAEAIKTALKN